MKTTTYISQEYKIEKKICKMRLLYFIENMREETPEIIRFIK